MTSNLFINAIIYFIVIYSPGIYVGIKTNNRTTFTGVICMIIMVLTTLSHIFVIGLIPTLVANFIGCMIPFIILINVMPEMKEDGEAFRGFFKDIRYTISRAKDYNDDIHYKYKKMDDIKEEK